MTITTITLRLRSVIAEQTGVPIEGITEDPRFADLPINTIDLAILLSAIEDEFGIEIGEGDEAGLTSVRAAVDYVTKAREAA